MKARNLARQQFAVVSAGQDEVALAVEDFDDGVDAVDETDEADIVEASAVEVPARIIEPVARRTKPRQLPRNHKRQGNVRGHQRSLRKTHSVERETDELQVEDEVKVTTLPEGDEVEVTAEAREELRVDAPAEEQEAVVEAEVTALAEGDEVVVEDAEVPGSRGGRAGAGTRSRSRGCGQAGGRSRTRSRGRSGGYGRFRG